jgi:hypothetical protein
MAEDKIKQLQQYKETIDRKKREIDKAIGKKDLLMAKLKDEFKISNIAAAKKLLEELKVEKKKLLVEFDEAMEDLRANYDL